MIKGSRIKKRERERERYGWPHNHCISV